MGAVAEREVALALACQPEPVGIGVVGWVAIGGAEYHQRLLAPGHLHVAQLEVGERDSRNDLGGAVVAQQLLRRLRTAVGMRASQAS